jgi:hypothetical protein
MTLGGSADKLLPVADLSVREAALLASEPFWGAVEAALDDLARRLRALRRLRRPAVRKQVLAASPVTDAEIDNHLMTAVFGSKARREPQGSAADPERAAEP